MADCAHNDPLNDEEHDRRDKAFARTLAEIQAL